MTFLVTEETAGLCRALHYDRSTKTFVQCEDGTQRPEHPYCYNCWLDLDAVDMAVFPPVVDGQETRMAIGEATIFPLSATQMRAYRKATAAKVQIRGAETGRRDRIRIKTRPIPPAWQKEDEAHTRAGGTFTVYLIRAGDGSVYVGQTRKLAPERFAEHARGRGAQVLKERGVVGRIPIWAKEVTSRELALELEEVLVEALKRVGIRACKGEDPDE